MPLTTFPDVIDARKLMQDPQTSTDLSNISVFNQRIAASDLVGAAAVLNDYPRLQNMLFNADKVNRHEDMIIALERLFLSDVEGYLSALTNSTEVMANADHVSFSDGEKLDTKMSNVMNQISSLGKRMGDEEGKSTGMVYEKSRTIVSVSNTGWAKNAQGWQEKTIDVAGLKTTDDIDLAVQGDQIGNVLLSGAKSTANGKLTLVCLGAPPSTFDLLVRIKGVR